MKHAKFTEKQLSEIYAFAEEYVEEEKRVEAVKLIKSMMRYDRAIMKQRLNKKWHEMLSVLDAI
jgi:CRISPR/Cas system CSM-associated protein Csm2 small subunit